MKKKYIPIIIFMVLIIAGRITGMFVETDPIEIESDNWMSFEKEIKGHFEMIDRIEVVEDSKGAVVSYYLEDVVKRKITYKIFQSTLEFYYKNYKKVEQDTMILNIEYYRMDGKLFAKDDYISGKNWSGKEYDIE